MTLVLDASLASSWAFVDEHTPKRAALLERVGLEGAVVPQHFRIEVANVLLVAIARRRITTSFRDQWVERLLQLKLEIDAETNDHAWGETLALATRYSLAAYDAAYLELALRRQLPLATLDERLAAAARRLRVNVVP